MQRVCSGFLFIHFNLIFRYPGSSCYNQFFIFGTLRFKVDMKTIGVNLTFNFEATIYFPQY